VCNPHCQPAFIFLQVRRYAAEQIYTMLLVLAPAEDGSQDVDAAMELLSSTAWDGPLDAVRKARSQVFSCFGLAEPVTVTARPPSAGGLVDTQIASADENASYAALLTHTQRGM
jgi:hypothetical protein